MAVSKLAFAPDFVAELDRLFQLRRDVRRFRSDPVSDADLRAVLEAAVLAPSVGLSQPWRFVVVDDSDAREQVAASFRRANAAALAGYDGDDARLYATLKLAGLAEAPVHVATFTATDTVTGRGLGRATMPETLAYSTVAAVQTLWLAARARGLGVGWVSIVEPAVVARALAVPAAWTLTAYLCVGVPETSDDVPELERAGWERRLSLDEVVSRR